MGVTRTVLEYGNGDQPKKGDEIIVEYTGYLYDEVMQCRGECFDASESRGCHFKTPIGVGKVIQGWDEGIMEMKLGERSILIISSDYAYGSRGFPGLIPPDSSLEFDVRLHDINSVMTQAAPKQGGTQALA